jgi:hypothetical protein
MDSEKKLCPSYTCQEGSILLGIVMRDGRVAFSSDRIVVNEEFVQIARAGRAPEKRFRFGGQCVQNGCKQWAENRCGVIESVIETTGDKTDVSNLPECSIRPECRWFSQRGAQACAVCPEVITDLREEIA